ncbi:MAG: hypothetical protein HY951_01335 [Bacteroidia bacterium]|nr:hypothetical protein [Bacteroidia bacterium]
MKIIKKIKFATLITIVAICLTSCNSNSNSSENITQSDSITSIITDTLTESLPIADSASIENKENTEVTIKKEEKPKILIYNFHVTNRCASCIAIENATKKTLDAYFKTEVQKGIIKLSILSVDDEANSKIAEKYQAFGSALFVTRVFKGKETTSDFTGDGFKYAKNKEEKFIEILKNKITEYLK